MATSTHGYPPWCTVHVYLTTWKNKIHHCVNYLHAAVILFNVYSVKRINKILSFFLSYSPVRPAAPVWAPGCEVLEHALVVLSQHLLQAAWHRICSTKIPINTLSAPPLKMTTVYTEWGRDQTRTFLLFDKCCESRLYIRIKAFCWVVSGFTTRFLMTKNFKK